MADKKCVNCGKTYDTDKEFCPRCLSSLDLVEKMMPGHKQAMLDAKKQFDSLKADPSFSFLFDE